MKKREGFLQHCFKKNRFELNKHTKGDAGFTLSELLVVIALMALITSMVFTFVGPARRKANDARRKADLRQINSAMELCYDKDTCVGLEKYPDTDAGPDTLDSIGIFMLRVPDDPLDMDPYYHYTWTNGTDSYYCVYVKSESMFNTWFCASNKGSYSKTESGGYTPSNSNCCGPNVME